MTVRGGGAPTYLDGVSGREAAVEQMSATPPPPRRRGAGRSVVGDTMGCAMERERQREGVGEEGVGGVCVCVCECCR